ncbi:helix-turn-helix domain-containing protein [Streptomyces sp. S1D4-14]|uniref:helix-turn-helix domain-containing protein n=1 Tax=Streptomyces sp. S1D4-14 TaxID=2594461 RepID=UPI0011626B20|nr:helix-turn-helix domain-containing protein [Streptomyces sp. S1D4-14]QDN64418.1 hypothetical protein FNV66_00875 [Streptomyces sp. S1D4-14]
MEPEPQPAVLTERQTRVLWLLSMGYTREDIVQKTGWEPGAVKSACARIFAMLKASTAAQAVRNGLLGGLIGPYVDCGSLAAYRRHIKREETTCPACKRGNRERVEAGAALRNRRVELSKAETRLMQAFDAGRTVDQICSAWGCSQRTVKDLTTSAYATLGVSHLPQSVRRESALREARTRGLLRVRMPDRPLAPPRPITLTKTQVRILVELEAGASLSEAAERLNIHPGTVSTRLSEVYRLTDVTWMNKSGRRAEAINRLRAWGLLPEPATT